MRRAWLLVGMLFLSCASPKLPQPLDHSEYSGRVPFGSALHPAMSQDPMKGTGNASDGGQPGVGHESLMMSVANVWFAVYQHTWSRADGPTCRFQPTCSAFAREAIRKHGLKGVAMAFARLQRNHSHPQFYGTTPDGRLQNPVEDY